VDARVTSVNARAASINAFLDNISAQATGAVSVKGLQSVVDTLSDFLSVHAINIDAVSQQVLAICAVSARQVGDVSVQGVQGVADALSNRISTLNVGAASATSQEISANIASASAVIKADIASVSAAIRTDEASHIASTSATIKADIASVSAVIKVDIGSVSVAIMADAASHLASASAAIMADTASHLASASAAILADVASHLASTSAAIKTDINSVSAAIMADAASHLSSTSAAIKTDIASVSAVIKADIGSVSAAIKADIGSVSAAIVLNMAGQFGTGQFKVVTGGTQAVATATFTKVSGLSCSIGGSGTYMVQGQLVWSQSGAGSASAVFHFGMSITSQPVMAMFKMHGNQAALGAAGSVVQGVAHFGGNSAICATPSIMYSAKPNPGTSGSITNTMFWEGILQASTVAGTLRAVVACSTGAFGIAIQPGSWMRAFKLV
jgi:hypothetical protein